jgi:serine/threonine protein kinase
MHRDIKPDNIGFDLNGVVKIVDFGLAREYDPAQRGDDGLFYNFTGKTGSLLYMDPDVFWKKPYNELCDVYSFSVTFWQILTLKLPYTEYIWNMQVFTESVQVEGKRPVINATWPTRIQQVLNDGWNIYSKRPTMDKVLAILQEEIKAQLSTEHGNVVDSSRYSKPARHRISNFTR